MKSRNTKHKVRIIIFLCAVFFSLYDSSAYAQEVKALIGKKCVKCHNIKRVYSNQMSAERWNDTVRRMCFKKTDLLDEQQIEKIVFYLARNNSVDRKKLFEKKCFDCHERNYNKKPLFFKKTKLAWKRSIERMRKKYCMFIGVDEAEEISMYWINPENNKNIELDVTYYDRLEGVYENKCGACHSYKFLYGKKYSLQNWHLILGRMYKKNPIVIKERDLKDIKDYLLQSKSLLVK